MASDSAAFSIETTPDLADDQLHTLYRHWLMLCERACGLPPLQSFDPLSLPRLLANIWIIEVDPESHRLRMRLAGENINAVYGHNVGGRFFRDIFEPSVYDLMVRRYSRTLTEPAVLHCEGAVYSAKGRATKGERIGLPMLGRSGLTDAVLGLTTYVDWQRQLLDDPLVPAAERFHRIHAANHRAPEILGG